MLLHEKILLGNGVPTLSATGWTCHIKDGIRIMNLSRPIASWASFGFLVPRLIWASRIICLMMININFNLFSCQFNSPILCITDSSFNNCASQICILRINCQRAKTFFVMGSNISTPKSPGGTLETFPNYEG